MYLASSFEIQIDFKYKKISVFCLVGFTKNIIVLKFEDIKVVLAIFLYFIMAINYNMTTQIKKRNVKNMFYCNTQPIR